MSWSSALFKPRSVAVVGSVSPGKIGRVLIDQLLQGGFENVVVVNPKAEGTSNVPAARSLAEIDARIDLAVIASPADTVVDVLEDAGRAGVKVAIVITAGFSESGNSQEEARLLQVAKQFGIRLVGPNCAGVVNTKHHLFPTLETRPPTGDVAFVSQSGALGGAVLSWAEEQGVGFSKFVSYGNGVDLTEIDFLDCLRDDAESKVVCLYIETVSNGRRFMEAARRLAAVKPLVVIKSGRSDSGSRATRSHTGSMAGSDAVYDASLRQCGAIRAAGIEEMFDLCRGFTMLPSVMGHRLAIVTNSGGPGVLASDRAEAEGLDVGPPSHGLRERLEKRLPPFCSFENPFDLTVQGDGAAYRDVLTEVLAEYDGALAINVNVPYMDSAPLAQGVVDAAKATGKPIAASFMAGQPAAAALPVLDAGGVPNFATGERATRVLAVLALRSARVARAKRVLTGETPEGVSPIEVTGATAVLAAQVQQALRAERLRLSAPSDVAKSGEQKSLPWDGNPLEPEAMDWLEGLGFSVIEHALARTAEEAVQAARGFEHPRTLKGAVVMKIVSPAILHKTDVGGVALGLETEADVRITFDRLRSLVMEDAFGGVLVSPMVSDPVEVIVGLSTDPQFGPVVAVGLGGIFTETLSDLSLRFAPVSEADAHEMMDELRGAAILGGVRGRPPRDRDALADLVVRVSQLPFTYPDIRELDLNPIFSFEQGYAIADVRVLRGAESEDL